MEYEEPNFNVIPPFRTIYNACLEYEGRRAVCGQCVIVFNWSEWPSTSTKGRVAGCYSMINIYIIYFIFGLRSMFSQRFSCMFIYNIGLQECTFGSSWSFGNEDVQMRGQSPLINAMKVHEWVLVYTKAISFLKEGAKARKTTFKLLFIPTPQVQLVFSVYLLIGLFKGQVGCEGQGPLRAIGSIN
jgi:hypothetical protein